MVACLGAGEGRVDPFLRRVMAVRSRDLVEEEKAAPVLALEVGPPGATWVVALVEERSCEERRPFLVVANDETVLGRTAETEYERRKVPVDRFLCAIQDQRSHL